MWVKRELLFALQDRRYTECIIPILYEPCAYERLSWTFASFLMISYVEDFKDGCRELLRIRGLGYQPA